MDCAQEILMKKQLNDIWKNHLEKWGGSLVFVLFSISEIFCFWVGGGVFVAVVVCSVFVVVLFFWVLTLSNLYLTWS